MEVIAPPGHDHRPSLLARHRGPAGRPSLLLNGHLDTVGAGGMADPFQAQLDLERGRLSGRGASDMKGGVAAHVVAAEAVLAGSTGDVWLALVADEEDASLGTEAVLAQLAELGASTRRRAWSANRPGWTWLSLTAASRCSR